MVLFLILKTSNNVKVNFDFTLILENTILPNIILNVKIYNWQ